MTSAEMLIAGVGPTVQAGTATQAIYYAKSISAGLLAKYCHYHILGCLQMLRTFV